MAKESSSNTHTLVVFCLPDSGSDPMACFDQGALANVTLVEN